MQRIHLDFINTRRPAGTAGWLLLLIALVCTVALVARDQLYWQSLRAHDADKLRALESRQASLPKLNETQLVAEWSRAMVIADELNLPWEKLFAMFEAEVGRPVAILSLDTDAGKRELALTGEARNFEAMLAYYRLLQQQEIFSGLALHTHQINRQDRENPIRFRITAKWVAKS